MKKLMLIVNPASGKGLAKKVLGNIVEVFRRKDYYSCVFLTSDRGQAYEFAHRYGADYDLLVCVGGNGTFSDVINGIIQVEKERRPVIGYIPTGTANDIASTFKLSKTPEVAAETALSVHSPTYRTLHPRTPKIFWDIWRISLRVYLAFLPSKPIISSSNTTAALLRTTSFSAA